jgi:type III secretion protein Q
MSALNLRRADGVEAALRRGMSLWRRNGMAIQLHAAPPTQARYIAFHADADADDARHGWDGLINCDEWLGNIAPELAALGNFEGAAEHAMQLFAATPQPLTATFPYRTITVTGLVSGADLQQSPLAVLSTPQATVWLRALPSLPPQTKNDAPEPGARLSHIPATLQFLLGASQLSRGCLSRVGPGDVLLVTEHALRMRCNALMLGWYSITEEGITVDELLNEPYEEAAEATLQASPEQAGEDVIQDEQAARAGIARIPVRLEFVLQQNKLTMGELGQLYSGQVIDLAPEAEKQVLVLANGAVLGRGELVQMDDRLGVEIIDLYGSHDDAH